MRPGGDPCVGSESRLIGQPTTDPSTTEVDHESG